MPHLPRSMNKLRNQDLEEKKVRADGLPVRAAAFEPKLKCRLTTSEIKALAEKEPSERKFLRKG